jgi:hypothetical protein
VKLDATSMLLFQALWASAPLLFTALYIFIDGSTQRRGVELFAGSFDMAVHGVSHFVKRRLFPQISTLDH